jgi:hypothetical protein
LRLFGDTLLGLILEVDEELIRLTVFVAKDGDRGECL